VTLTRDRRGVPYIAADSERGVYFGLGFAHAQDRLFQMDLARRTAAGTLSELIGSRTVDYDRFRRTFGFQHLVETDWAVLGAPTRGALEAYAAGVNAFLDSHRGAWPLEYVLLRATPAPWRPVDSLLVLKSLDLLLGTNLHDEIERLELARRLPLDRIADLWPAQPGEVLPPLPPPPETGLAAIMGGASSAEPGGSNAWVVDGSRTTTGKPLLANDPHLDLGLPGKWYLVRLEFGTESPSRLVGATLPGLPFVVLGHNGRVAWGFANAYIDTQDVFVERIDPADPDRYLTPEGSRPFGQRDETLRVAGGDDVSMSVRTTRHGPVISDAYWDAANLVGEGYVLALAWTALVPGDTTANAALGVARARSVAEFAAAAQTFVGPIQNMAVADVAGGIGLTIPGLVPVRPAGIDGSMPAPGWTGGHDWLAFGSVGTLAGAPDRQGTIVTANNRVVPEGFPLFLARDWPPPYRALRIAALLAAKPRHAPEDFVAMQGDVTSPGARAMLPVVRAVAPNGETARRARALLDAWDGDMAADRPEPLVFAAWLVELWRRIAADDLGPTFEHDRAPNVAALEAIFHGGREAWCDDATTSAREDCAAVAGAAFDAAVSALARRFGADPALWRWGTAHRAHHAHVLLGRIPWLGALFTLDQPIGGDRTTIDVSSLGWSEDPYISTFGAGYRAVYDLADLDGSLFQVAVGQSGNLLSRHATDLAAAWLANEPFALPADPAEPVAVLRLEPDLGDAP